MSDKKNCPFTDCNNLEDCGKTNCQIEMVELLKKQLKTDFNLDDTEAKEKIIDIVRLNLKQDINSEFKKLKSNVSVNYSFSRFLFDSLRYTISLVAGVTWLAGFVIAKGFWSTVFCIIPFYSWYLIVELYLAKYGL
jgi:hypothetical protein